MYQFYFILYLIFIYFRKLSASKANKKIEKILVWRGYHPQCFRLTDMKLAKRESGLFQKHMSEAFRANRIDEMHKLVHANMETVKTTTERGIITMALRLAIQERDETLISVLFGRLSMKRDYFELMIYKRDPCYSIRLFEAHIDAALLEPKDLSMFVEHGMTYLFRLLDGKFIHYAELPRTEFDASSVLRRYALPDCNHYIEKIVNALDANPKNKTKRHIATVDQIRALATSSSIGYDVIIDGGNALHARNGQPNPEDLRQMITILQTRGHSPLVVIHVSHTDLHKTPSPHEPHGSRDYVSKVKNVLETSNVQFVTTPYGLNDDLFILLAYLIRIETGLGRGCSIVTRDTYTDHMEVFKNRQKNVSDDFGKYLAHDLVSFTAADVHCHQMHVPDATPKPYTNCIQIVEPYAYIPLTIEGPEFARILIQ
jgi:hypothetical protein